MRPLVAAALGATLVLSTAVPALAHPNVELAPTLPTDVTHARTDNLDYLGRFPEHAGTAGGRLVGDTFFVTDPRGVFAYDVSDPTSPTLAGAVPLFQNGRPGVNTSALGNALAQEDPDTDGEILVVDGSPTPGPSALQVVDVSDPTAMTVIGTADVTDHTWTCVSATDEGRCDYVYGRSGWIVDLTVPAEPVVLDLGWRDAVEFGFTGDNSPYTHDLTQIRPGLVMTSGIANLLLDTSDPKAPVLLNTLDQTERFTWGLGYHSVEWAQGGTSPIAVFGTEIAPDGDTNLAGSDCQSENSVIETWDATEIIAALAAYEADPDRDPAVVRDAEFKPIDSFDVSGRGLFLDGDAPAHVLYCAHWMEPHPDFDAGGLLAVSYYDRGTRFLRVDDKGIMSEIAWIVPAEGYSGSVQWIGSDGEDGEVAYIMDYRRGMEVVNLRPADAASAALTSQLDLVAASATVTPLGTTPDGGIPLSSAVAAAFGLALAGVGTLRRRRVRAEA